MFNIVLYFILPSPDYEYRQLSLPDNFTLPDARVIAIGTVTHGNAEPYDVTVQILQKIKEEKGNVAFVLEEQVGDGAIINQIHSFYDNDRKMPIGFYGLYNNDEMDRLLSWIESENVNFYGVDIQNIYQAVEVINRFLNEKGYSDIDVKTLKSNRLEYEKQINQKTIKKIENVLIELLKSESIEEYEFDYISHILSSIQMNYEFVSVPGLEGGNVRDRMMAENVLWIMEHELKHYNNENVLIFAHNFHVLDNYRSYDVINIQEITMGHHLSNYLGDDYYTIVTEAKKNSFLARENRRKRKEFSIERTGSLIDTIGAELPSIKFCTSEYLKQAGISAWRLTMIGDKFSKLKAFASEFFAMNVNVETCFDAMLYFDQLTPNNQKK
ncbi:erythromycin esterase family protein [Sedimentibacter sp.]|uniref:erythromycin esterase family protein n=1 Tax=Sedimentibacter sp. TaxID=1960295 RepID=UPI0028A8776D|nr:erythromycin esterase family protein [Sedimentibacter sp.]